MKAVACPTCKQTVEPDGKAFPFCSERCRLVDLGKWLGGSYRVAGDANRHGEESAPSLLPDDDDDEG